MKSITTYLPKENKLLPFAIGSIVILLAIYIIALNFAVSENFKRGRIERDIKVTRQDIQEKEEIFISNLTTFYDQYAAAFEGKDGATHKYVSRESNFALSSVDSPNLR